MQVIDKQYTLGSFDAGEDRNLKKNYEDNVIVPSFSSPSDIKSEENGAYFWEEYEHGTPCTGDDVDSEDQGVERSSTIRYFCGSKLEFLEVKEDRTCHYIVDISVPDLCHHPLFQVDDRVQGQVVKCLPVPV